MDLFLAGVANAVLMDGNEIFAEAKTLTDSSISIGVTAEDIRGGQGNKLFGKFFHDSTFDLTLTDAMFRLEYIAAHVGSDVGKGADIFFEEKLELSATPKALSKTAVAAAGQSAIKCWVRKFGSNEAFKALAVSGNAVTLEAGMENGEYVVRYFYAHQNASAIRVASNFIPKTLSVIMTANLYSGDASNPSTGTKVGYLVIKVPRFLLSGTAEISMTADGAATTPLEGSALAFDAGDSVGVGCGNDNSGYYAEIIQVECDKAWYDEATALLIEDSDDKLELAKGATHQMKVYAIFGSAKAGTQVPFSELTCTTTNASIANVATNGMITAGTNAGNCVISVSCTNHTALADTIQVQVLNN